MTSPNTPDLGSTSVKWRWPSVHPEGRKFVLIAAVVTLIFALVAWETLAWPMAGITVWVAAFFRDPIRTAPLGDGLVIAPADGLITMIVTVPPPKEMAGEDGLGDGPMTRVSIFMSVFDVHINRAPIAGTIKRIAYIAGKFLNADLDKASEENERQHILVEAADGTRIGFTQIAGLVARRIVPFVKVGEAVGLGQRVGLIRFGSRVDIFLPAGTGHRVTIGQRTIAGETVIARLGEGERTVGMAQ
jgi:phosphatidylserine decarboxylase